MSKLENTMAMRLDIIVFLLGAISYGFMEILFRGFTHWTMCITGGACVLTFFYLESTLTTMPLLLAALLGAAIITVYEFSVGLIVNVGLGWQVWDYSAMPGNVMGQICPLFFAIWFGICLLFFAGIKVLKLFFM